MMSLPDFKQKQIIYINAEDFRHVQIKNSNLFIAGPEEETKKCILQVPLAKVFAIFFVGNGTFTSVLLKKLMSYGIMIFFTNINFKVYASLGVQTEGNTLLRKTQYTMSEKSMLGIAQNLIANKIENQIRLLKEIREKDSKIKTNIKTLKALLEKIPLTENSESLLGLEGNAAKLFFQEYFKDLKWKGRKPRTKYDIPNTLLDVGYTILFSFVEAQLRLYGFDIYNGVYHRFFYERKSLVCDMVEPFRWIIDKSLRKAWNLGQVDEKDFIIFQHQYTLSWKKSGKYAQIFLEAIMEEKENIFLFIQKYYRNTIKQHFTNTKICSS